MTRGWANTLPWLLAGIGLMGVGLWRRTVPAIIFVAVAGGMIGLWRGGVGQQELAPYKNLIGYKVEIRGIVLEDPEIGKHSELVLRVGELKINDHKIAGMVWVSVAERREVKRSDVVTVRGVLEPGFGNFASEYVPGRNNKSRAALPWGRSGAGA